jgi:hypothetical protein
MAGRSIEYNLPRGNMWQPVSPANAVKAQMKFRANQRLPLELRRNRNTYRAAVKVAERKNQIRAAHAAAAAAPMTAANIAFQMRLNEKAAERRALQNNHRAAQNEIRRQRHINASEAARAMLNAEGDNDEVNFNSEVNSRNNLNPIITNLQSQIYALEHANPVNSVELEKVRAMLEVAEAREMIRRINEELPRLILEYGENSIDVRVMLDAEQEALERSVDAVARLEALQAKGGRRRTRKHKNRRA